MQNSFVLVCLVACGAATAQTPTANPMPDGSRDMYLGLGAVSRPAWEGARERTDSPLPMLQVQWSNGAFVSGMSAGIHLSPNLTVEYGPLVSLHPRRSDSGFSDSIGTSDPAAGSQMQVVGPEADAAPVASSRLHGMTPVSARLQGGVFVNRYLGERLRMSNRVLYGAGNDRDGLLYIFDVQHLATDLGARSELSAGVGFTLANRAYTRAYFGVSLEESMRSNNPAYAPSGGLKDLHASLRWKYNLTAAWMLSTQIGYTRLAGNAADSPLVERKSNHTVSTALAYRF